MALTITLVGSAIFISALFAVFLHVIEWMNIGTLHLSRSRNSPDWRRASPKLAVLKAGLGIETVYYFLLLIAFAIFFPTDLVFLTLIAVLSIAHLAAFQAAVTKAMEGWLQKLTLQRITGILVFDILEIVFLVALALKFYSMFVCSFGCSS